MAAYLIAAFDVADADAFASYNPGSVPVIMETLGKHGGKVIISGPDSDWLIGGREHLVVLEFPSTEAARAWESDPDYAAAKAIRVGSTTNRMEVVAPQFVMPE